MKYFQDPHGNFYLVDDITNIFKYKSSDNFMYKVIIKKHDQIFITKGVYDKLKYYFNNNAIVNDDFISDSDESSYKKKKKKTKQQKMDV